MRLRHIIAVLVAVLASCALVACGGGGDDGAGGTSAGTTTTASEEAVSVTFVGAGITDPYYLTMRCGAEQAARDFNIDLDWQGVNGVDFAPEVAAFNAVVQRAPDGIVLVPFSDTAFVQPARQAVQSGIKLITADVALAKRVELKNIRTDNVELGGLAAEEMARAVGESGKVAVVSFAAEVPVQADRVNGFKQRIAEIAPGIEVVAVEYGGADAGRAAQKVAALLQRFPELDGIFATDTADAEGTGSAIKAAGRTGKTKLIAYDASPKLVSGLRSGLYDALIAQDPYRVGYDSFESAAAAVRGTLEVPEDEFWQKTGGKVITRDNVDSADVAKYLYTEECA